MTDKTPFPSAHKLSTEDERNNPVYKAGRAVVIFMGIMWAVVVIAVLYSVFKFWLS
ncbi:hypothetical protein [Neisseria yangbaofengii]|uniref:hypothetical protein n=1 Tax=Neisseria yangbaofengii TaxID=2709396 RepID=UPI0013ED99CA|nr:hypothetical protein [Neisseria yangbaofengii]